MKLQRDFLPSGEREVALLLIVLLILMITLLATIVVVDADDRADEGECLAIRHEDGGRDIPLWREEEAREEHPHSHHNEKHSHIKLLERHSIFDFRLPIID